MTRIPIIVLALASMTRVAHAAVEVPLLLTQTGRLFESADTPASGARQVRFEFHETADPTLRNPAWFDERSVDFHDGYYAVVFGDTDRGGKALDPVVLAKPTLFLSIVLGTTELLPRLRVTSVPFALRAGRSGVAEKVAADGVDTAAIAGGAVTEAKLADGAVSTRAIADGSATELKLADGAASTRALAAAAVTEPKLADGAVSLRAIAAKAVAEAKIADDAVSTRVLGAKSVTEPKLDDGAVSSRALAAGAVAEAKLDDAAVSTRTIGTKSVTEGKLDDFAVSSRTLVAKSITEAKLDDAAVSSRTIGAGSVLPSHLHTSIYGGTGTATSLARSDHTHAEFATKADRQASFAFSNSKRSFAFTEGDWRKMTNFDDLAITTKGNPLLVHVTFQINDDICLADGERYAVGCQLVVDNVRYVMGMQEHDTWCDFETVYNYTSVIPVSAGSHAVFLECRHDRNNASNMNSNMGNRGLESPFNPSTGAVGTLQDVIVVQELGR